MLHRRWIALGLTALVPIVVAGDSGDDANPWPERPAQLEVYKASKSKPSSIRS